MRTSGITIREIHISMQKGEKYDALKRSHDRMLEALKSVYEAGMHFEVSSIDFDEISEAITEGEALL